MSSAAELKAQFFDAIYTGKSLADIASLLKKGADPNSRNNSGRTPLSYASCRENSDLCRLFLDSGAEINSPGGGDQNLSALSVAACRNNVEVCRYLLEKGADTTTKSKNGYSVMHWVANKGHMECARLLLEHEADPRAKNDYGKTAIEIAKAKGFTKIVDLFEKGLQPEPTHTLSAAKRKRESDTNNEIHALIERAALAEGKLEVEIKSRERAENELKTALERCAKAERDAAVMSTLKLEEEKRCKEALAREESALQRAVAAESRAIAAEKFVGELMKEKAALGAGGKATTSLDAE